MSEQINKELEKLLKSGRKMTPEEFEDVLDNYLPSKTEEEKNELLSSVLEKENAIIKELKQIESDMVMIERLNGLEDYVKLSKLADTCFGKSKAWLYHRLHGHRIHGKPVQFTEEEKRMLSDAFLNLSNELKTVALKIV